jgi:hypothetical protein
MPDASRSSSGVKSWVRCLPFFRAYGYRILIPFHFLDIESWCRTDKIGRGKEAFLRGIFLINLRHAQPEALIERLSLRVGGPLALQLLRRFPFAAICTWIGHLSDSASYPVTTRSSRSL